MTEKVIVNCTTGETEVRPLTREEQDQREADTQAARAETEAVETARAEKALRTRARLARLLNAGPARESQQLRDDSAEQLGVKPLRIPLERNATEADIVLL